MPRKLTIRVPNSLLTSSKQYDEDRPSQDSVSSHSSASSQDTLDVDQTDQFSTSSDSDSVEDDQKQLIREYVAKCKANNKIKKHGQHAKNWQEHATRASIEQYYITEESHDDFENIKTEPSNEESEQLCYSSASTSISDPLNPLMAPRPTQAAEVICLQQISEAVSEENSDDASPLASYRRYQQHSEKRELSEEKLRQLAIKHVDALRVICHRINIQQYLPKCGIKESVEQDEQHHSKTIKYGTQTVSETVVKHELQDESTCTASETVEQHEQSLAKGHSLYLTDIEEDSEDADIHPHAFEEIKTELSSQGYDQIYEVTASDSIADLQPNVNDEDITLGEFDPLGGISDISVKTENNVLEEEYEVEKFIQMEIDIEPGQDVPILKENNVVQQLCQQNIIRQYVPSSRTEKSVEQGDQILRKLLQCVSTQTVSDHVDHDHQYASKYKPNESVEQRQQFQTKLKLVDEKRKKRNQSRQQYLKRKTYESVEWREQCIKNIRQNGSVGVNFSNTKLREPCRNDNIGQCELEHRASKSVENYLQCLDKLPQDGLESREIESFQLVQPHRTINIQQYISKHRSGETDGQRQQRIENFRSDLIRKVNQCIEKYESRPKKTHSSTLNLPNYAEKRRQHQGRAIQNYLKQKSFCHAEEREKRLKIHREYIEKLYTKLNAEERIQMLEKLQQHGASESIEQCPITGQCGGLYGLTTLNRTLHCGVGPCPAVGRIWADTDTITESRCYIFAQEIKSGPSEQEYNQLCEVTELEDVGETKLNVNGDDVYKINLHDDVASNYIRTEDTVVEEEYDDGIVLKMEIDVESEGVQQTEFKDNNSLVDHNKVQDIIDDIMQKLLEEEQKEDINDATRVNRTTENKKYGCYGRLHKRRANKSVEQCENCLEKLVDVQKYIPNESVELLQQCLNKIQNVEKSIANESVQSEQTCTSQCLINESEKRKSFLKEQRRNKAESQRANETVEQRQRRLEKRRQYYLRKVKGKLNDEQYKQRAEYKRQWHLKRISNESAEEREQRQKKKREYDLQRSANETIEQRKQRLDKKREYDKKRRAN